ncbi:MAG: ATP-binding protein [Pseudomonadota bacterium]
MNNAQVNAIRTKIDIVLHVDELLDEQNRRRVEHAICRATGVERARFNDERQHLLIVGYDPVQINSTQILKLVQQHDLSAQLIGGI